MITYLGYEISYTEFICSAQSQNRYNSGIILRKVGILTWWYNSGILYRYNSRFAQGILVVYRTGKSRCAKWESNVFSFSLLLMQ